MFGHNLSGEAGKPKDNGNRILGKYEGMCTHTHTHSHIEGSTHIGRSTYASSGGELDVELSSKASQRL